MQSRFDFRSPRTITALSALLTVVMVFLWWQGVYQSPKKVWSGMLTQNLTTQYVTKSELSSSNDQGSLQQISLQLGKDNLSRSLVTVKSTNGSVTTESIGQKGVAYIRYTAIKQPKRKQDFQKVTNVWASSKGDTDSSGLSKLFVQSLLDVTGAPVPPLGYVAPDKRRDMLDYIAAQNIFSPDFSSVKTQTVNGRKAYAFTASVKLAPYLRLMQDFSHVYGLTDLDNLSPSQYQSAAPVKLTIDVDVLSHQMVRVSQAANGFNETYTDYGVQRDVSIPSKTISTSELRDRLSKLQ